MVRRGDIDGIWQEEVTLAMRRPRRAARGARVQICKVTRTRWARNQWAWLLHCNPNPC